MIEVTNIVLEESGSPTEPVSLDEAKEWLRVDFDDDDELITDMIKSARQSIEHFTNRALVPKDISLNAETPTADITNTDKTYTAKLPYTKGSEISELLLTDWEDTELVEDEHYVVKGNTIHYLSGYYGIAYTVTPTVPTALKEDILMEVAERYNNRGETNSEGLSKAAEDKAAPFAEMYI